MLIVLLETLQDINTTPKELKTERDCSHRELFRQYGATTRESWMKNIHALRFQALTQNSQHLQNHAIPRVFWGARVQVSS